MKKVNNINYQLNALLDCIDIYADLNSKLLLSESDVKRLSDYINTQNEKIKQLRKLAIMLDKSNNIVNMTKEIEEIEL